MNKRLKAKEILYAKNKLKGVVLETEGRTFILEPFEWFKLTHWFQCLSERDKENIKGYSEELVKCD